jgi:hypothetical protein
MVIRSKKNAAKRTACARLERRPSGGLVDIDQEVVTLRGPFGTIPGSGTTFAGAPILTA